MSYQNRYRGSNRPYQDADYTGRRDQRYPGSMQDDFSQFGGPRPGGYRDYAAGETGWSPTGGPATGYAQRDYAYDHDDRGDYRQNYAERQAHRGGRENYERYQNDEPYYIQHGGYPDYSGRQRDYPPQRNQGYTYASQDRGNMDAPMDRDWGAYGEPRYPARSDQSGHGYDGRQSYTDQTGYGAQNRHGQSHAERYSGQSGYYGQGSSTYANRPGYTGSSGYRDYGYEAQTTQRQGPKGYQRSDDRIREQIVERLMDDTNIDLQDVECNVKDGVVTLTGHVKSRHCRHELENIADSVWGVKEVNNNVKVHPGDRDSSRQTEMKPGSSGSTQRETTSSSSSSQQSGGRNR